MSSHKSRITAVPTEPKRARGRLRVAAILDAAAALFAAQDYDAVTMTAIAARSGAAIGSLYRFFPTKEAVADALLRLYGERVDEELAALAARAPGLAPREMADALADFMAAASDVRAAAGALVEARSNTGAQSARIRALVLGRLAEILGALYPALPGAVRPIKAQALLHLLKLISAARETGDAALAAEARGMVRRYMDELGVQTPATPDT